MGTPLVLEGAEGLPHPTPLSPQRCPIPSHHPIPPHAIISGSAPHRCAPLLSLLVPWISRCRRGQRGTPGPQQPLHVPPNPPAPQNPLSPVFSSALQRGTRCNDLSPGTSRTPGAGRGAILQGFSMSSFKFPCATGTGAPTCRCHQAAGAAPAAPCCGLRSSGHQRQVEDSPSPGFCGVASPPRVTPVTVSARGARGRSPAATGHDMQPPNHHPRSRLETEAGAAQASKYPVSPKK